MKATVLGAAGGIGQSVSLLLKINCPLIDDLSLYDVVNAHGVAADLSHIATKTKISSFLPENDGLQKALEGSNIVVIPAGVPRKPGMTRDDLFNINAGIVRQLAEAVATICPDAFVLLISNPVNSTTPIFAETLRKHGVFNPRRLFGVTTLDNARANTFVAEFSGKKPEDFNIPVIGGHSGTTIVPLFSIGSPKEFTKMSLAEKDALIHRVQYGGDEVVKAKEGKGSATLSMAYAAFSLVSKILNGLAGNNNEEIVSYIYLDDDIKGSKELKSRINNLNYFAIPFKLSSRGIEEINYKILDQIDDSEKELLDEALEQLNTNIVKGVGFTKGQ